MSQISPGQINSSQTASPFWPPLPTHPNLPPISESGPTDGTSQSAVFQRLPREIRDAIFLHVLESQAIHLHLSLEHSIFTECVGENWKNRHARIPPYSKRNPASPCSWIWRSSYCHDVCFLTEYWKYPIIPILRSKDRDICLVGEASCTSLWSPFNSSMSCKVGALGWLKSCRQAYQEGMPLFYGSSTFRIHGTFMFHHLPDLLPSHYLRMLRRVSLAWSTDSYSYHRDANTNPQEFFGISGLYKLVSLLPITLPNVQYLHISLNGSFGENMTCHEWSQPNLRVYEGVEKFLEYFGIVLSQLQSLAHAQLCLPKHSFVPWMLLCPGHGETEEPDDFTFAKRTIVRPFDRNSNGPPCNAFIVQLGSFSRDEHTLVE